MRGILTRKLRLKWSRKKWLVGYIMINRERTVRGKRAIFHFPTSRWVKLTGSNNCNSINRIVLRKCIRVSVAYIAYMCEQMFGWGIRIKCLVIVWKIFLTVVVFQGLGKQTSRDLYSTFHWGPFNISLLIIVFTTQLWIFHTNGLENLPKNLSIPPLKSVETGMGSLENRKEWGLGAKWRGVGMVSSEHFS